MIHLKQHTGFQKPPYQKLLSVALYNEIEKHNVNNQNELIQYKTSKSDNAPSVCPTHPHVH